MREFAKMIALDEQHEGVKIKGHTRIELTTVATGEKKIIEHENTFQSAIIAKQLRSLGVFNNSPWVNDTWNSQQLWRNLVGGIMLFENDITTPADFMPAGNKMVANGSYGVSNTGNPSELGSYNDIESSTSGSNSISLVYDWGTSQGNGTIGSVCLTSELGGYIGMGNPSGNKATGRSILMNQASRTVGSGIIYKNHAYSFAVDRTNNPNNVLVITKTKRAVTEASIFNGKSTTINKSFSLSLSTIREDLFIGYGGNGIVVLIPNVNQLSVYNNGDTITVLVYDIENDTLTTRTITNTTGQTICLFDMGSIVTDGDVVFLPRQTSGNVVSGEPSYAFQTTTGNLLTTYGGNSAGQSDRGKVNGFCLESGLWILESQKLNTVQVWDVSAETFYPMNMSLFDNFPMIYNTEGFITKASSASFGSAGCYKNPLYLATVNNLDSPVTKDSTQTMKIIYTLTEASA